MLSLLQQISQNFVSESAFTLFFWLFRSYVDIEMNYVLVICIFWLNEVCVVCVWCHKLNKMTSP